MLAAGEKRRAEDKDEGSGGDGGGGKKGRARRPSKGGDGDGEVSALRLLRDGPQGAPREAFPPSREAPTAIDPEAAIGVEAWLSQALEEEPLPPLLWLRCQGDPTHAGYCLMADGAAPAFSHDYGTAMDGGGKTGAGLPLKYKVRAAATSAQV